MRITCNRPFIISLLFSGIVLFSVTEHVSGEDPYQAGGHRVNIVDPALASEDKTFDLKPDMLRRFKKNGKLCLTLNDSIRIAIKRNPDIRLVGETLAQAEADITRAWSSMLPFVGAEAGYTQLDEDLAFGLGPISLTFMDRDIYKAGVVLRQPVFMGGRLNAARKAAQYYRNACSQDRQSVKKEIVFQVTSAYHAAQATKIFQRVALEAVSMLEKHEHDVNILVREGANPRLDLLRTQTELANAKKEFNAAANAFDIALSVLKNLLVIDLEEFLSLTDHLGRPPGPATGLSGLTGMAVSDRSELLSLKLKLLAAKQGVKAAKGAFYPIVALEGRYEYMQGDFRDLDGDDHWTAGIGASVPLWNWGKTRANVKKAESRLKQVTTEYRKTEDYIRLEVRRAFLNLRKAEKNIEATEAGQKTAKEAYRHARAGYRAGEGTNTEVLDARTSLSRARANYTQALFEYNVAIAALNRAIGTTVVDHIVDRHVVDHLGVK